MYSLHRRCDNPDASHLRVMLADLYSGESHYPKDPFTGEAYKGGPTSMRGQHAPGIAELEALDRDLTAAHDEARRGVAARDRGGRVLRAGDGQRWLQAARPRRRARARGAPAAAAGGDPLVADARIEHARLLVATKPAGVPASAIAELREVLATAPPGTTDRLVAALELYTLLHDTDLAAARGLEAGLRADLEHADGTETFTFTTVATAWAFIAHGEHRDGDAAAILAAAVIGAAHPNPTCHDQPLCDPRYGVLELLDAQAKYDHAAAVELTRRSAAIHAELDARDRQDVEALDRLLASAQ